MGSSLPSEVQGWDEIEGMAGGDSIPVQNKIRVKIGRKTVFAMVNLGESISSLQKQLAIRFDNLNSMLEKTNVATEKQSNRMLWLTVALVAATTLQAVVVFLSAIKVIR